MAEKAQFGALDISPGAAAADSDGKKEYKGMDRRKDNRRQYQDRRTEIRFEPSKEDRRQNPGRREDDDKGPSFW